MDIQLHNTGTASHNIQSYSNAVWEKEGEKRTRYTERNEQLQEEMYVYNERYQEE
jgi:hypothetical protein